MRLDRFQTLIVAAVLLAAAACRSVPPDPYGIDPDFRRKAAQEMTGDDDAESLQTLVLLLTDTHVPGAVSHPTVRSAAARSLGPTRAPAASAPLAQALEKDDSDEVRTDAAIALGDLGQPDGVAPLRAALARTSEPPKIRRAAADALGRLVAQEAVPDLVHALRDADRSVVLAAHRSLIAITGADRGESAAAWDGGSGGGVPPR